MYKQGDRVVLGKDVGVVVEILDKELAEKFGHPVDLNVSVLFDCRRVKKGKFWVYEAIETDVFSSPYWCKPQALKLCGGKPGMKERRSKSFN